MIPRAGPGGVLLPRVHRRLLNTEAEAALTLTLPLKRCHRPATSDFDAAATVAATVAVTADMLTPDCVCSALSACVGIWRYVVRVYLLQSLAAVFAPWF